MGFFKKLFRIGGKKGKQNDSNTSTIKAGGNTRGENSNDHSHIGTDGAGTGGPIGNGGVNVNTFSPSNSATAMTMKGKSPAPSRRSGGADLSAGSQRPILSPRNDVVSASTSATFVGSSFSSGMKKDGSTPTGSSGSAPVDLDESIYTENTSAHATSYMEPVSGHDENHQHLLLPTEPLEGYGISASAGITRYDLQANEPPKTMFSAGQINVTGSEDLQSDGESSSFNLSTDAEDTEYEALRRRIGGMPASAGIGVGGIANIRNPMIAPNNTNNNVQKPSLQLSILDTSDVSQTYNTDGEGSIFPNLPTDDEATMTESQSGSVKEVQTRSLLGGAPYPDPEDEHDVLRGQRMDSSSRTQIAKVTKPGPADDPYAWNPDTVTTSNTKGNTNSNSDTSFRRSFNSKFMDAIYGQSTNVSSTQLSPKSKQSPRTDYTGKEISSPKHEVATPTAQDNFGFADDPFADFADFSTFETKFPDFEAKPTTTESPHSQVSRGFAEEKDDKHAALSRKFVASHGSNEIVASSSASAVNNETSLSELLAQAKSKTMRNGTSGRRSGSSVNSAPVVTGSYLRQQHNLKPGRHNNNSVSDIIQSLEAANVSRMTSTGRSNSFHNRESSGSSRDGAIPSFRTARERARRRREREERRLSGAGSNEVHSSDEEYEDDNRINDSWLFKEVEETLGPRGSAADMESLSGRSNRSNSSRGNRSHKSHRSHRSHRSRTSTGRRRHPTASGGSGDSVDSHGEKSHGSRRSRSSRYSHKSARSYISQMSEQSRSVANDLLRLEMQLKMVGTNDLGDGSTVGDRSIGGRSASRTSASRPSGSRNRSATSAARRSRLTVTAPPGKLGIILVNKADSKGTVVSGVRTSSVLADKVHPGDRIVAIDGEDVSHMSVSEITTIMSRKSEFERTLTILTTPRHLHVGVDAQDNNTVESLGSPRSPTRGSYNIH